MNPVLKWLYKNGKKRHEKPSPGQRALFGSVERDIAVPEDLRSEPDVSYETEKGVFLKADIVMPSDPPKDRLPVIVLIHGGAFLFGDRRLNLSFKIRMARLGYLVYSLEYRLLQETDFFGALADINHGLQFVKDSLDRYNGDPERIHIVGESAGGLLAIYSSAMCGSDIVRKQMGVFCPDIKIRGLILSSGMIYTTRKDYIAAIYKADLYGKRRKDKEFMKYMNPENPEIIRSLPGVCLVSGYGDFLRKMTLRYGEALQKAQHPVLLLYCDEGNKLPHAFMTLVPKLKESGEAIDKMHAWIGDLDH